MADEDAPEVQVVRRMMQKILDDPDASERAREMARQVLNSDPDEIKTQVKFIDLDEEEGNFQYIGEPSLQALAIIDENMDEWIRRVREEQPTTAQLASGIMQLPPGWTLRQGMEMVAISLANALQRLAFGSAD